MKKNIFLLLFTLILISCNGSSLVDGNGKITIRGLNQTAPEITSVSIENNQVIVKGSNLLNASKAQVQGNTNHTFTIESRSENRLVLNARSALSLLVGGAFNLIISNAAGAATYPITFEIQNGQVTAAKLHNMGATSGQFLRYNGTSWGPASMQSSLIYTGTYNATTDTPDISAVGGPAGTFYIVTTGGTQNLGSGPETFAAGDWAIFDGTNWSKVPMSGNSVSSFNGRMGVVVPLANDYSWGMLSKTSGKLTGSKISDIADVVVTGIQDGDVLSWDQSSSQWVAAPPAMTIAAGSVTSTEIASGAVDSTKIVDGTIVNADISATAAIAQSKIQNLTTDLAAKEAAITAGTTLQYYRGDKSWQTLNTTAVAEGTNLYFLDSRVRGTLMTGYAVGTAIPIDVTDTLMQAFGKLEAQITASSTSTWSKTGSIVYYTGGNVGIGTNSPAGILDVQGGTATGNATSINLLAQTGGGAAGNGGSINLTGGNSSSTTSSGGSIVLTSGKMPGGSSGNGSSITLAGVQAWSSGSPGAVTIYGGNGNNGVGHGGYFKLLTGTTTGAGQSAEIIGGNAYSGTGGNVSIDGGTGTTTDGNILLGATRGNVSVGATAPGGKLDVNGDFIVRGIAAPAVSSGGQGRIYFDSTANKFKVSQNGGAYADLVSAGTASQWTTSGSNIYYNTGKIGVGQSSPVTLLDIAGSATDGSVGINVTNIDAGNTWNSARLNLRRAGGTVGTPTPTTMYSELGQINFYGYTTGNWFLGAQIRSSLQTSPGFNAMSGDIEFLTNNNDSYPSSRMILTSAGNLGIKNSSPGKLLHVGSASVTTGTAVANFQNADGTCTITPASSGSGIACSSDERLKENFQEVSAESVLNKFKDLQAYTYNFKTSSSKIRRTGFKADQVKKIAPEFVRENEDGFLQVYYDAFIPWITEAIKKLFQDFNLMKEVQQNQSRKIANIESREEELKKELLKKDQEIKELRSYLCAKDPKAPMCH